MLRGVYEGGFLDMKVFCLLLQVCSNIAHTGERFCADLINETCLMKCLDCFCGQVNQTSIDTLDHITALVKAISKLELTGNMISQVINIAKHGIRLKAPGQSSNI